MALDPECYFTEGDSEHQLWLCSQNDGSLGRVSIQALDPLSPTAGGVTMRMFIINPYLGSQTAQSPGTFMNL